jgi:hypothetical protein
MQMTMTRPRAWRSERAARVSGGAGVSATPRPARELTASAESGPLIQGMRSAPGVISSVIAMPGITTATTRPVTVAWLPPRPTAASAAAMVSSSAATTSLPVPTQPPSPSSAWSARAGAPSQMLLSHWYGPTSAATIAGARRSIAIAVAGPAASMIAYPGRRGRSGARARNTGSLARSPAPESVARRITTATYSSSAKTTSRAVPAAYTAVGYPVRTVPIATAVPVTATPAVRYGRYVSSL